MGDAPSWAAVFVSVVALLVSVVSLWQSSRAQREANAIQRRLVEIEEQRERDKQLSAMKASLRPELRKTERGSDRLYIANSGDAGARNVRVSLDGLPLKGHPAAVHGDDMPAHVRPRSEVSCLVAFTVGRAPPLDIEVRWDDDFGADRAYRRTLTF